MRLRDSVRLRVGSVEQGVDSHHFHWGSALYEVARSEAALPEQGRPPITGRPVNGQGLMRVAVTRL